MKRKGSVWIALGLLLLAAALFLCVCNMRQANEAGDAAQEVLTQLELAMEPPTEPIPQGTQPAYSAPRDDLPDYVRNPDMEMPTETIRYNDYIGVLSIPALELELPIISQWNYKRLNVAPCRYTGSAYKNNMTICGHNYVTHFGKLKNLRIGDSVTFTDVDGNVFSYEVLELESLIPTAVEEMTTGDWDLTLFTCGPGGRTRVTVRCVLAE